MKRFLIFFGVCIIACDVKFKNSNRFRMLELLCNDAGVAKNILKAVKATAVQSE
jgi:hypothetical protein